MKISNISKISDVFPSERQTGKAETDARRLAVWIERVSRFAPEIGVKRSDALHCSPIRTKRELDAALAVLLEQGRVTLAVDRRAHRIIPTAVIGGWMGAGMSLSTLIRGKRPAERATVAKAANPANDDGEGPATVASVAGKRSLNGGTASPTSVARVSSQKEDEAQPLTPEPDPWRVMCCGECAHFQRLNHPNLGIAPRVCRKLSRAYGTLTGGTASSANFRAVPYIEHCSILRAEAIWTFSSR